MAKKAKKGTGTGAKRKLMPKTVMTPVRAPTQMTAKAMEVTPAMALKWLEGRGPNRNVVQTKVDQFARDMKAGVWHLNGETVIFDEEGALLDGQHRLWAVAEAGVTVRMLVVQGAVKESMESIDTGMARTFGHLLTIKQRKNAAMMAAAARWFFWYDNIGVGNVSGGGAVSHAELGAVVKKHPLIEAAATAVASSKARLICPAGVLTFIITGALERDAAKAESFLNMMATGQGMTDDTPVLVFREKMVQNRLSMRKLPAMVVAAYGIKTWNAFLKDRPLRMLKWSQSGDKPEAFPRFEDK